MKLPLKTILVPLCTLSLLVTGMYVLLSRITVESFDQLETNLLDRQVERVKNAVDNVTSEHAQRISDWAQWDNTYEFINSLDPKYISENLNIGTLSALGFSSVLYLSPDFNLRYGATIIDGEVKTVPKALVLALETYARNNPKLSRGIILFNDQTLLVATAPILPNSGEGEPRGILMATSVFDQNTIKKIRYQTNINVTRVPTLTATPLPTEQEVRTTASRTIITRPSNNLAQAFGEISDSLGKTVLRFRVDDLRAAYASGLAVRNAAVSVLSCVGAIAAIFLALFVKVFAVRRIEIFSKSVNDIWKSKNLSLRLKDTTKSSRSLRLQTAAGIIALFVATTIGSYFFLSNYFLAGFSKVEKAEMRADLERGRRALLGRLEVLKGKVTDWAQWDDTYQFITDRNSDYVSANLEYDTLGSMNIKYVLYFDNTNKLVLGRKVNSKEAIVGPIDTKVEGELGLYPNVTLPEAPISGILSLNDGPVLIGASPILDTSRTKPKQGGMIFAAAIDSGLESQLSEQTRLNLKFRPAINTDERRESTVAPLSDKSLLGETFVADLAGHAALKIQVTSDRPVYFHGQRAAHFLPLYFIICGLICTVITVYFTDKFLLERVRKLGSEVSSVQNSDGHLGRVAVSGGDELSGLAANINRMLTALESAQLEIQVAKDAAERANQAKSMFIARVSHELRTPVAGIIGLNDMLLKRVGGQRGVRELLNMQGVSAEGLLTIINEILDFSTIEQGKLTFENIEFEPRAVVKDAMQVVTGRLLTRPANTPLQLVLDVDPTVAKKLKGDPTKLKQILVNLIGNGIKFTQQGYVGLKLTLNASETDKQHLQFSVWDTGIGIPSGKLASVFEPFTQADESVKRKYQGTGLGLTIVKQMAEGMGGSVSVESVEGSGSTFTVSIPFETVNAAPYQVTEHTDLWPTSFLVIGEKSPVRESVVTGLSSLGGIERGVFEKLDANNYRILKECELIVLLEDAAQSPEAQKLIADKDSLKGCVVPVVSIAQGELRQKLHTDGIRTILSYPVLADDIIGALIAERVQATEDAAAASIARSIPTCGRPLRILVADDTLTNRIVLEDLLTEAGHSVVCVDDGQKLVDRLRPMLTGERNAEGFDIVLTDISMPTMDGYSATQEIRALEQGSGHHIPIVAITAHILTEEQAKMKASGMDDVLTKPVKPEAVAAVFQSLVKD